MAKNKEHQFDTKENGKNATGRPSSYKPEYCQALIRWFDVDSFSVKDIQITNKDGSTKEYTEREATPLPMLVDFAKSIGVCYVTVYNWAGLNSERPEAAKEEFVIAYKEAIAHRDRIVIQNGLLGLYNGYFAKFFAENNMGMKEAPKEVTLTIDGFAAALKKVYGKP